MLIPKFVGLILAGTLFLSSDAWAAPNVDQTTPKLLFSISGDRDFPNASGVIPEAFDFSPDGKRIAVEFEVGEGSHVAIWIGEWEIATKQLIRKKKLELLTGEHPRHPQFMRELQYSPDGSKIITITGPHLFALDASTLEPEYSLSPTRQNNFLHLFSVSADGSTLALAETGIPLSGQRALIHVADASNGKIEATWELPAEAGTLSLSPDGAQIATNLGDNSFAKSDIFIFNSKTGELVSSFSSGFNSAPEFGAGWILFVDSSTLLVTPGPDTDRHWQPAGRVLKLLDVAKRSEVTEFSLGKSNPTGILSQSADGKLFATVTITLKHPRFLMPTDDVPGQLHLLVFDRNDPHPVAEMKISSGQSEFTQDPFKPRVSNTGQKPLIGLFQKMRVEIYQF
jgi:WD40 repeat protein